jgi:hypothetical protein
MAWIKRMDKENKFFSIFNTKNGFYIRSGILDENMKDTGVEPFRASFPHLLDIGIMGSCVHGQSGLCAKSGVQCYQSGATICKSNMSLDNFKKIISESKGKVFQVALGGRGDVDMHEQFEEILQYCVNNNITPNFTTSGLGLTDEKVEIIKKYCGATAISYYRQPHTYKAIDILIKAGCKTNIHYVVSNDSIDEAINLLETDGFPKGINAVVFLLHKPVGTGTQENVLRVEDPRVKKLYSLVNNTYSHKIGFDSCSVPALNAFAQKLDFTFVEACESSLFSAYIDAEMVMYPCSFAIYHKDKWGVDLNTHTMDEVWKSEQFESFRQLHKQGCGVGCKKCDKLEKKECRPCPIVPETAVCAKCNIE